MLPSIAQGWPLGLVLVGLLSGAVGTAQLAGRPVTLNWIDLVGVGLLLVATRRALHRRQFVVDRAVVAYGLFLAVAAVQVVVRDDPAEILTGMVRFALAAAVLIALEQLLPTLTDEGAADASLQPQDGRWHWPVWLASFGAVLAVLVLLDSATAYLVAGKRDFYDLKNAVAVPLGASNYLAAFLMVTLVTTVVHVRRYRWLVAPAVLVLLGLVATLSRGALVALVATAVIAVIARWSERLAVGTAVAVAVVLTVAPLVVPVETTDDLPGATAVFNRLEQFEASVEAFVDAPLIGVGLNRYQEVVVADASARHDNAHNLTLHALAETGLLGALSYLALWALLVARILRMDRCPTRTAIGLATTALFFHAQVEALAYTRAVDVLVAVMLALTASRADLLRAR